MPDPPGSSPLQRLTSLVSSLNPLSTTTTTTAMQIPFNPDATTFPTLHKLPPQPNAPPHAAWVWGPSDNLGRLNLLTPARTLLSARETILTGLSARLDLPLHVPATPAFGRCKFEHRIKAIHEGIAYDDEYTLNTQSGTQWDGFRHVAWHQNVKEGGDEEGKGGVFYNGVRAGDWRGEKGDAEVGRQGKGKRPDGEGGDNLRNSTHWWSEGRGMSGRGVLLDYRRWVRKQGQGKGCAVGETSVSYAISLEELREVGRSQGIDIRPVAQGGDIRPGDILMIRTGWTEDYYARSEEENATLALRDGAEQKLIGVEQSQEMIEWLHDCWFAAVGGDQPAFERWPTPEKYLLHEYLLGLWGVPIGEMLDLERAGEICEQLGRWFFFVSSAPPRCEGGVGTHVNGTAIW